MEVCKLTTKIYHKNIKPYWIELLHCNYILRYTQHLIVLHQIISNVHFYAMNNHKSCSSYNWKNESINTRLSKKLPTMVRWQFHLCFHFALFNQSYKEHHFMQGLNNITKDKYWNHLLNHLLYVAIFILVLNLIFITNGWVIICDLTTFKPISFFSNMYIASNYRNMLTVGEYKYTLYYFITYEQYQWNHDQNHYRCTQNIFLLRIFIFLQTN